MKRDAQEDRVWVLLLDLVWSTGDAENCSSNLGPRKGANGDNADMLRVSEPKTVLSKVMTQ